MVKPAFLKGREGEHKKRRKRSPKFMLHRHLYKVQPKRSHHIVHASDISPVAKSDWRGGEFCAREFALLDLHNKEPGTEQITTSLAMVFHLGNSLADKAVHTFADMGRAVGNWVCLNCNHKVMFTKRPEKCQDCGFHLFDHVECRFQSLVSGVSCGVDMFLEVDDDPLLLPMEIKTMTPDDFKELKGPLAEHRWRTNLYLRIIDESGGKRRKRVNTEEAVVFYISKSGHGSLNDDPVIEGLPDARFSPFKEYVIKRDDEATQERSEVGRLVKVFREGGPMPPRICPHSQTKRAKYCPVVGECFDRED